MLSFKQKPKKDNLLVRKWGECKTDKRFKHHHELLWMIDGYDPERGKIIFALLH